MNTQEQIIQDLNNLIAEYQQGIDRATQAIWALMGTASRTLITPEKHSEPNPVEPVKRSTGVLKDKTCLDCGATYTPTSNVQKRCGECGSKKVNQKNKPPE